MSASKHITYQAVVESHGCGCGKVSMHVLVYFVMVGLLTAYLASGKKVFESMLRREENSIS